MEDHSKEKFIVDTSALISLGIINLLDGVLSIADIIISSSVIKELESFAEHEDAYGKASEHILKRKQRFIIEQPSITQTLEYIEETDNELFNIATAKKIPIITDDIKLTRHIGDKATTYFSTFFLTALVATQKLSRNKALELLEELSAHRNWRKNIIYLTAKEEL